MPEYGEPSDDESEIDLNSRNDRENQVDLEIYQAHLKELEEVQILIDKLGFEDSFDAEEFIQYDASETTREMISDEEILKAVQPNNQEEEEAEEESLPTVIHSEAIECYDKVILYLQQQEKNYGSKKENIKSIKKLKKEALKERFISTRQTNLDNFIHVIE